MQINAQIDDYIKQINILIGGFMGAGKSCYINSIASIFNESYKIMQKSYFNQDSVTTEFCTVPITKDTVIKFIDMPGFDIDVDNKNME